MPTTTIETVAGPMVIDQDELQIGRFLDAEGKIPTHDDVIAFMKRHVKEGDSVIDVGANAGFFTLVLSQIVGKRGHVTAFEPNYEVFQHLEESIVCREMNNIDAVLMAIGREKGWADLRFDPRGPGGTQVVPPNPIDEWGIKGTVMVRTLDTAPYIRRPVSFIKIDTEGMDVDVLRGALHILEDDRPVILFEWNPEAMSSLGKHPRREVAALCDLLDEVGYVLCDYRTDEQIFDWDVDQSGDYALMREDKVSV